MIEATKQSSTLVTVTQAAAEQLRKLLGTDSSKSGLRLEVRGGGCSGMSYGLSFDNPQEKDHIVETQGVCIFIDPKSAIYLKGIELDFQGGLQGRGFTIKNPQATGTCGCGQSFNV